MNCAVYQSLKSRASSLNLAGLHKDSALVRYIIPIRERNFSSPVDFTVRETHPNVFDDMRLETMANIFPQQS